MQQNKIISFIFLTFAAITALTLVGCGNGSKIDSGSKITIAYSLKIDGKDQISPSRPEKVSLVVGKHQLPAMLENSLIGLKVGSTKTVALSGNQAYGPVKKELFTRVPQNSLPQNIELKEGAVFNMGKSGSIRVAKILDDNTVVLDRNHPLAGNKLIYNVKVLKLE